MRIRPETPADYAAVAAVHARAFGHRSAESAVVALSRSSPSYDPQLSLVAERDGHILGHVLLLPRSIRLLGSDLTAVNLAPIAVDPDWQRQGIGGALIEEAHHVARSKRYALCFLLGDPAYYTRFGYVPSAFGAAFAETAGTGYAGAGLHHRGVTSSDPPALRALWRHDEADVDFSIDPGCDLLEWISPHPAMQASVYTVAGEVAGYTRVHSAEPHIARAFLARDGRVALAIARTLAQSAGGRRVTLPLHPASRSAAAFGSARAEAWEAGMVRPFAPSPFEDYYALVQSGRRPPGRPVWPVVFDLG